MTTRTREDEPTAESTTKKIKATFKETNVDTNVNQYCNDKKILPFSHEFVFGGEWYMNINFICSNLMFSIDAPAWLDGLKITQDPLQTTLTIHTEVECDVKLSDVFCDHFCWNPGMKIVHDTLLKYRDQKFPNAKTHRHTGTPILGFKSYVLDFQNRLIKKLGGRAKIAETSVREIITIAEEHLAWEIAEDAKTYRCKECRSNMHNKWNCDTAMYRFRGYGSQREY